MSHNRTTRTVIAVVRYIVHTCNTDYSLGRLIDALVATMLANVH